MKDCKETKMFLQGITVWLIFAFGFAAIWLCSLALVYFMQNEKVASPLLRFGWAATAASVIVGAFFGAAKLYRARRG